MVDRTVDRLALYEQGLNDYQIAEAQGVHASSIQGWRKRRGLRAHISPGTRTVELQKSDQRAALYQRGLNDHEIAAATGSTAKAIGEWRRHRNLPGFLPKGPKPRCWDAFAPGVEGVRSAAHNLMRRGVGITLIADVFGLPMITLGNWRRKLKAKEPIPHAVKWFGNVRVTASGRPYSRLALPRRRRAFALYARGMNDIEIAQAMSMTRTQIWQWRSAFNLPAVSRQKAVPKPKRSTTGALITPRSNPLYAQIADAVGRGIAADIADDAMSEMFLAVLEGRLTVEQIAGAARRFRGKALGEYADPYTRSLDMALPGTDDLFLIDTLVDDSHSDWLERSGATVW